MSFQDFTAIIPIYLSVEFSLVDKCIRLIPVSAIILNRMARRPDSKKMVFSCANVILRYITTIIYQFSHRNAFQLQPRRLASLASNTLLFRLESFISVDGLRVEVRVDSSLSPLATDTRLLDTTEDGQRRRLLETVDPYRSGLQSASDRVGLFGVFAPHACAETGVGVVGAGDDFVQVRPWLCWDNWTFDC